MNVSRETDQRLADYAALVRKWNARINLISPSTVADLESRHIDDCLHLARLCNPTEGNWADLGSGGGFPGIVLSIATQARDVHWTLVESDQRKAAFLRTAIRELALSNTDVLTARIESLTPLAADGITARALAPLPRLVPYLQRHLAKQGQAWLMKGKNWEAELFEAAMNHAFSAESFPSATDQQAAILKLSGIET